MKNHPEVSTPATKLSARRAIAYFRCSVQDRQENSIAIQKNQVRQWAHDHGIEIIHEFCDIGQAGLESDERPVFTEMLEQWIKRGEWLYFKRISTSFRLSGLGVKGGS